MPRCDFETRHEFTTEVQADELWAALQTADLARSPGIRLLFALRGIRGAAGTLADIERFGFVRLEENPPRELALGLVGRFWTPAGGLRRVTPEEFRRFAEPGHARVVWNFETRPLAPGDRTLLLTRTRILCTDDRARRGFARYWRLVRPFSGWIRGRMLRIIRDQAVETRRLSGSG